MQRKLAFVGGLAAGLVIVMGLLAVLFARRNPTPEKLARQKFVELRQARTADRSPLDRSATTERATSIVPMRDRAFMPSLDARESELLDDALDPYNEAFHNGDEEWVATAARLNDLSWLREERLECAAATALDIHGQCIASFEMLVSDAGKISRVRSNSAASVAGEEDACNAYVECLAASRVDAELPIPSGQDSEFGLRQRLVLEWVDPVLFDPNKVEELIALYEADLDAAPSSPDAREQYDIASAQDIIDYLGVHLADLQDGEHL
jgi:hypothetical protein